jgi:hypothetical protein
MKGPLRMSPTVFGYARRVNLVWKNARCKASMAGKGYYGEHKRVYISFPHPPLGKGIEGSFPRRSPNPPFLLKGAKQITALSNKMR